MYQEDPEKRRLRAQRRWQRDKVRLSAQKREWYVLNAESQRAKSRARYAKNIDARRATQRDYDSIHRGWKKRKDLKAQTAVGKIDYGEILAAANGKCGLCQKPFDLFGIHFDHIIPLSRGGRHTMDNLQATHAYCNQKKGNRTAA